MNGDGILTLYTVDNIAEPGRKPTYQLTEYRRRWYEERRIGYGRQYAARGVNENIDLLARIWQDRGVRIGMVAEVDGEQYQIDNVQHLRDSDGLRITDITLRRINDYLDK